MTWEVWGKSSWVKFAESIVFFSVADLEELQLFHQF